MIKTILKFAIVRQVLGALGGALLALAAYNAYQWSAETVRGYLIAPGTLEEGAKDGVRFAAEETGLDQEKVDRITARAREAAENMRSIRQAQREQQTIASVAPSSVSAEPLHAGAAPALPGSGVGIGLALCAALGAALAGGKKFGRMPVAR